ncbi:hypothetical protein ACIP95_19470 [Micromonospora parva]|uniref:Lecithin:cholesterol acyltransferase n=1 Tax=Micromonospora parva TaxID=1464048 RepID=A0ABW6VMY7_9ACTN|nr:hypothetical protein [Micromonospora parva]
MGHDLVVVVPGLMGSVLRDDQREVWNRSAPSVWAGLTHHREMLHLLRLPEGIGDGEPEGPHRLEPCGLVQGWHVLPGLWAGAGYHRLLRRLSRLPAPQRVVAFAYDWRLSVAHNAAKLAVRVQRELERWRSEPGEHEAKVTLVCHSMGGLIAATFAAGVGREITRRVITIGTPFSGSVKAVRAFTGHLAPAVPRLNDTLAELASSFPSVADLLPTYRCVRGDDGRKRLDQVDVPTLTGRVRWRPRPWQGEGPASGGPTMIHFGGRRQPTDLSLTFDATGVTYHPDLPDLDVSALAGDGTVAPFSCLPAGHDSTDKATYWPVRHSGLQSDPRVLDHLVDAVNGIDLGAALGPEPELSLTLPEVVRPGVPCPIHVTADVEDLPLRLHIEDLHGRPLGPPTALRLAGDGYHAAPVLPGGVWHVSVRTSGISPATEVGDIVVAAG